MATGKVSTCRSLEHMSADGIRLVPNRFTCLEEESGMDDDRSADTPTYLASPDENGPAELSFQKLTAFFNHVPLPRDNELKEKFDMGSNLLLGDPIPLRFQDVPEYAKRASSGSVGWRALFSHLISLRDQVIVCERVYIPGTFGDPKIFVQFDGSAYHDLHIGGAGAGLFEISAQGLQLLDWGCLALPLCKDNIVAEVMGADLALRLYDRYVQTCHQNGASPLELDKIQGDIKPLVNHLQFHGRFRRPDLTYIIDQFHQRRSRIAPLSTTEYRPREANFVADYLAGQGSAYLLQMQQERADCPTQPVCLDVSPPYELLSQNHAVIAGLHAGGKFVLALLEMPGGTVEEMACNLAYG